MQTGQRRQTATVSTEVLFLTVAARELRLLAGRNFLSEFETAGLFRLRRVATR